MSFEREEEDRRQCYQYKDTGSCDYADRCRFWHGDQPPGAQKREFGGRSGGRDFSRNDRGGSQGVCYDFRDNGNCRFGDRCRFSHGDGDNDGMDRRERRNDDFRSNRGGSQGVCYNFRDNGDCRFGDRCRFSHDTNQDM